MPSPAPDPAALCTRCGACCLGAIHAWGALNDDELDRARAIGLTLLDDGRSFALPCGQLLDRRCAVYAERPAACAGFRCKLLVRFQHGEASLERALGAVAELHAAMALVAERWGRPLDLLALERELHRAEDAEGKLEARQRRAPLLLALGRLREVSRQFADFGGDGGAADGGGAEG